VAVVVAVLVGGGRRSRPFVAMVGGFLPSCLFSFSFLSGSAVSGFLSSSFLSFAFRFALREAERFAKAEAIGADYCEK